MFRSTGSKVGAAAVAITALAMVAFGGEKDECSLNPDGIVHFNGSAMSEEIEMGEGEIGDTVALSVRGSTSGMPLETCTFVEFDGQ